MPTKTRKTKTAAKKSTRRKATKAPAAKPETVLVLRSERLQLEPHLSSKIPFSITSTGALTS